MWPPGVFTAPGLHSTKRLRGEPEGYCCCAIPGLGSSFLISSQEIFTGNRKVGENGKPFHSKNAFSVDRIFYSWYNQSLFEDLFRANNDNLNVTLLWRRLTSSRMRKDLSSGTRILMHFSSSFSSVASSFTSESTECEKKPLMSNSVYSMSV